jgi:plasmid replication initiation protein
MSVIKSNALIEASYKLTLNEQRILLLSLGKFDPTKRRYSYTDRTIDISAKELSDTFGMSVKHSREALRKASDDLFNRVIIIKTLGKNETKRRWIEEKTIYVDGTDRLELIYTKGVMPFIAQLTSEFTIYKLGKVAQLKSCYSIRLFELLSQWRTVGQVEFSIEKLKSALGIEGKYSEWRGFRRVVLERAVKELAEKSDLEFSYETTKTNRKITGVKFIFNTDKSKAKGKRERLTSHS